MLSSIVNHLVTSSYQEGLQVALQGYQIVNHGLQSEQGGLQSVQGGLQLANCMKTKLVTTLQTVVHKQMKTTEFASFVNLCKLAC